MKNIITIAAALCALFVTTGHASTENHWVEKQGLYYIKYNGQDNAIIPCKLTELHRGSLVAFRDYKDGPVWYAKVRAIAGETLVLNIVGSVNTKRIMFWQVVGEIMDPHDKTTWPLDKQT